MRHITWPFCEISVCNLATVLLNNTCICENFPRDNGVVWAGWIIVVRGIGENRTTRLSRERWEPPYVVSAAMGMRARTSTTTRIPRKTSPKLSRRRPAVHSRRHGQTFDWGPCVE